MIMQVCISIALTLLHLWFLVHFQLSNYIKKPSFIKVAIFSWCCFSIKLSWLQRRSNKNNTILYDRYYLKTVKPSHWKKLQIKQKIKKHNIPSHLYIFWLNIVKANHIFLYPFLLLGEIDFRKNAAWGNE